jgi:hypothetical protein
MADFKSIEEIKDLCIKAIKANPEFNEDCVRLTRPVYLSFEKKLRKTSIEVLALNSIYYFHFPIGEEVLADELYEELQIWVKNIKNNLEV